MNKIIGQRKIVKEITQMAKQNTTDLIFFSESYLITDRFHIVKLVMEALHILD
jgi:hypothetical protein